MSARTPIILTVIAAVAVALGVWLAPGPRDEAPPARPATTEREATPEELARQQHHTRMLYHLSILFGQRVRHHREFKFLDVQKKRIFKTRDLIYLVMNHHPASNPDPWAGKQYRYWFVDLHHTFVGSLPRRPASARHSRGSYIALPDLGQDLPSSVIWLSEANEGDPGIAKMLPQLEEARRGERGVIRLGDGEKLNFEMLPKVTVESRQDMGLLSMEWRRRVDAIGGVHPFDRPKEVKP